MSGKSVFYVIDIGPTYKIVKTSEEILCLNQLHVLRLVVGNSSLTKQHLYSTQKAKHYCHL